jgi:hypothetical protein
VRCTGSDNFNYNLFSAGDGEFGRNQAHPQRFDSCRCWRIWPEPSSHYGTAKSGLEPRGQEVAARYFLPLPKGGRHRGSSLEKEPGNHSGRGETERRNRYGGNLQYHVIWWKGRTVQKSGGWIFLIEILTPLLLGINYYQLCKMPVHCSGKEFFYPIIKKHANDILQFQAMHLTWPAFYSFRLTSREALETTIDTWKILFVAWFPGCLPILQVSFERI